MLDKANVKRSGAIAKGMDGVNNAVIPGHATPEQYVKEITIANDGIVYQKAIYAYASRSFDMIRELDHWGVKFEKDETGDYAVKKVHHSGAYVLPMPEGDDVKKIIYRQLRARRRFSSQPAYGDALADGHDGRIAGAIASNTHSGYSSSFGPRRSSSRPALRAGSAFLRPAISSAHTKIRPTPATATRWPFMLAPNLSSLECFQINPLIKDYNGPACAYVDRALRRLYRQ